jgi:N-acetyl-1-D-myo-inositol-2-amino-2-deoxy-alpha-D-glucopyranoside deacetylase
MATPSLLAIFAHPDDEAFITGGALALCADRGVPTYLVSATAGDAGRAGGLAASREDLAAVRTAELAASCALLGVREHAVFGYGDGRLAEAPFDEVVGRVVELVRRWRPSVAVTFGREGGSNSHRDHRAICRVATAAVLAAGDERCYPDRLAAGLEPHAVAKLYHASAAPGVASRDGTPFERATTRVDIAAVRDRKLAAFRLHASQAELVPALEEWIAKNGDAEYYARVLSRVAVPDGLETDLFAGLAD